MIIVKLMGGLGNQMFQYAVGRSLSLKNKTDVVFDISSFQNDALRDYQLHVFNISGSVLSIPLSRLLNLYNRFFPYKLPGINYHYVRWLSSFFNQDILKKKGIIYLEGYWQCEDYFKQIREILKKDFTLRYKLDAKNKSLLKVIQHSPSVAVHVRRGDYVVNPLTHKYHGTCSLGYYHRSFQMMAQRVSSPHFFIFSDDMAWTKQNLKIHFPTTYVDINGRKEEHKDLMLMANCRHFIIANSSFSWWGAWLSENKNKIVFSPDKWFNQKNEGNTVPQSWIRTKR
ncbi:alpha-1,2-fucosyltransferase [Candidatus Peregrinibacteria bacterium]|nr:alpha-1,2-fucosyltransferase [Candidatus Peregrinibacteria bacterium]